MATGVVALVLVTILAVGLGFLTFGAVGLLQLLRLWRANQTDGGPLDSGVRSVSGRVSPTAESETVHSPATGERTLLYEYALSHRGGSAQTPDWRTVTAGQNGVPFLLSTDGGAALVDPDGAGLDLPVAQEVEFVADPDELSSDDPPIDALAIDREADTVVVGDVPLANGERYRLVERRLAPDDVVTVTGRADTSNLDTAGASSDYAVVFDGPSGRLRDVLGVPYVVGDDDGGAATRLRNRAVAGVVFGLPLVMLSSTYLVAS